MRVNLDVAKVLYSRSIGSDQNIKGTIARNRVIPEELGLIRYLLSDKTGTLTRNEMIFKKLSLEKEKFTYEQTKIISQMVLRATRNDCLAKNGDDKNAANEILDSYRALQDHGMNDGLEKDTKDNCSILIESSNPNAPYQTKDKRKKRIGKSGKKPKKNAGAEQELVGLHIQPVVKPIKYRETLIRDVVHCMVLCNNVTPIMNDGEKSFQASSPDEVALVKKAEEFGVKLKERTQTKIIIKNAVNMEEELEILANFPFSSERKRMGIIVRSKINDQIVFYLKGADIVMKDVILEVKRGFLLDECENLSKEGLRTLVLTQKILKPEEFRDWNDKYIKAQNSMVKREEKIAEEISRLEQNMEFLAVAGVEDKLQEDITKTIENLRNAGIKIWVLTGDKAETAKCIAISAGIKEANHEIFEILNITKPEEIESRIIEMSDLMKTKKIVLLIDGVTLTTILESKTSKFFTAAKDVSAVICARCAPTQKAKITKVLKTYSTNGQVAAIGDGGNDVGMIQEADVGVGIVGKEGMQAALASDFSIEKFKYLEGLLLWHGRLSYKRSAALSQFVIHRGLIISVLQAIFTCSFYFVSIPIYNGWLMLGYSTIYTTLPVFCLVNIFFFIIKGFLCFFLN